MSDLQQKQSIAEANLRRIQLQNAARAQKVSDLFWNDKQRLLYGDNAISVNEPETYANLIQSEDETANYDEAIERDLLYVKLTKISSKQTADIILNKLTDPEVLLLNSYFPDFIEQLKATFGKQPTNQKIIIDFIKNYLGKKVKITHSDQEPIIETNYNNIIIPEHAKNNELKTILREILSEYPALSQTRFQELHNKSKDKLIQICNEINMIPTDEFNAIKEAQDQLNEQNLKKNNSINTISQKLKDRKQDKLNRELQKQEKAREKQEKAENEALQKITRVVSSRKKVNKAKKELEQLKVAKHDSDVAKHDSDVANYNSKTIEQKRIYIEKILVKYPNIASEFARRWRGFDIERTTEKRLNIIFKHVLENNLITSDIGKGLKHGRGLDDKPKKVDKYKVDTKLLNKNILCIKYNSTGNIKMKPIDINDDIKAVVMDIMTDKFNDRLYQKLTKDEQKIIQHFINEFGISEKIPLKNTELEKLYYDFTILRGEYMAGNDSDIVKKDLRKLTLQLIQFGRIPSSSGKHLLFELSL